MFIVASRIFIVFAVAAFAMTGTASAQTAPPSHVPLQKTIGAAKPEVVPSLFVLNAKGAALQNGKLVLTGVSPNAIVFADRPVRSAGHDLTSRIHPATEARGRTGDRASEWPADAIVWLIAPAIRGELSNDKDSPAYCALCPGSVVRDGCFRQDGAHEGCGASGHAPSRTITTSE